MVGPGAGVRVRVLCVEGHAGGRWNGATTREKAWEAAAAVVVVVVRTVWQVHRPKSELHKERLLVGKWWRGTACSRTGGEAEVEAGAAR